MPIPQVDFTGAFGMRDYEFEKNRLMQAPKGENQLYWYTNPYTSPYNPNNAKMYEGTQLAGLSTPQKQQEYFNSAPGPAYAWSRTPSGSQYKATNMRGAAPTPAPTSARPSPSAFTPGQGGQYGGINPGGGYATPPPGTSVGSSAPGPYGGFTPPGLSMGSSMPRPGGGFNTPGQSGQYGGINPGGMYTGGNLGGAMGGGMGQSQGLGGLLNNPNIMQLLQLLSRQSGMGGGMQQYSPGGFQAPQQPWNMRTQGNFNIPGQSGQYGGINPGGGMPASQLGNLAMAGGNMYGGGMGGGNPFSGFTPGGMSSQLQPFFNPWSGQSSGFNPLQAQLMRQYGNY